MQDSLERSRQWGKAKGKNEQEFHQNSEHIGDQLVRQLSLFPAVEIYKKIRGIHTLTAKLLGVKNTMITEQLTGAVPNSYSDCFDVVTDGWISNLNPADNKHSRLLRAPSCRFTIALFMTLDLTGTLYRVVTICYL